MFLYGFLKKNHITPQMKENFSFGVKQRISSKWKAYCLYFPTQLSGNLGVNNRPVKLVSFTMFSLILCPKQSQI